MHFELVRDTFGRFEPNMSEIRAPRQRVDEPHVSIVSMRLPSAPFLPSAKMHDSMG